jgi:hypothetical protein
MTCIEVVVVVVTWGATEVLRTTSERRSFLSGRSYAQETEMHQKFEDEGAIGSQAQLQEHKALLLPV